VLQFVVIKVHSSERRSPIRRESAVVL
jgi:hypothetical protein